MDDQRSRIEARRIAAGLSRSELATLTGVTPQTIHHVERTPSKVVKPETLAKIVGALDAAEAARATPRGTDASLRAELDGLRTEVAALSSQVFELLETLRLLGVATGRQPGGLQGLQPRPSTRQSRT